MTKYTKDLFTDILYYDETSPTCLRWKQDIKYGPNYSCTLRKAGDIAGSIRSKKPSQVKINHSMYFVHRIIICLINGEISDTLEVDHINGNNRDNRYNNLRVVERVINTRNRKQPCTNTSGATGVYFRDGRFIAQWNISPNKKVSKSFSIIKYGDNAFKLACEHRKKVLLDLNEQGAGYSERHLTH